jgi:hypothetical protein
LFLLASFLFSFSEFPAGVFCTNQGAHVQLLFATGLLSGSAAGTGESVVIVIVYILIE